MSTDKLKGLLDIVRQIAIAFEVITPEIAKQLLNRNFKLNRGRAKSIVAKYAAEMRAGKWAPVSVLYVGPDGQLWDGQHRCMACIESGVSFVALVLRNVPYDYVSILDQGFKRSPGVRLRLSTGGRFTEKEAQIARILHALDKGNWVESAVSASEIEAAALRHEKAIVQLRSMKNKLPATFNAAIALAYESSPEKAAEFAKMVIQQAGYKHNTPPWRLVKFFSEGSQGDSDRALQVQTTLEEFRAFAEGRSRKAGNEDSPVLSWLAEQLATTRKGKK